MRKPPGPIAGAFFTQVGSKLWLPGSEQFSLSAEPGLIVMLFLPDVEATKWRPDLSIIAPAPVCCENAWDRYATSEQHRRPGKRRFVGKSRVAATRVQGRGSNGR